MKTPDQIAKEAVGEYWMKNDHNTREGLQSILHAIIQAAIEEATEEHREAIEELVDWQNGPPLLSPKWLNGWNGAMEKASKLIGRKHERQNT